MTTNDPLTYSLAPPDRTGLLLGLHATQLLVLGISIAVGTVTMVTTSTIAGAALLAVGAAIALAKIDGVPALQLAPTGLRWLRQRLSGDSTTWYAEVPLLDNDTAPPFLAEQRVLAIDPARIGWRATTGPIAVVHDIDAGLCSASFRTAGPGLALIEPQARDQQLGAWGTALDAFVQERTAVAQIRWSETAAPAGVEPAIDHLNTHRATNPHPAAETTYRALLADAGPVAVDHDVIITVTVRADKVRVGKRHDGDRETAAIETLLTETRLFAERLSHAGLHTDPPMTVPDLARTIRLRLDPTTKPALDTIRRALDGTTRALPITNAGPLAVDTAWTTLAVDGSLHRCFVVHNWPRLDVPGNWLEPLLMWSGAIRTFTVIYEPVARSTSQRDITRSAAKLEGDATERSRRGFRVGANIHHAADAVERREHELVAGYGELTYAGLCTVTAPTPEALDEAADLLVMTAASVGVELRPLHGRHDAALTATLPLARSIR